MSILWIVGGVGLVAAIGLALFTLFRAEGQDRDLGTVSTQWVSEHRLGGQTRDSHR